MSALRQQHSSVFENLDTYQYQLYANKYALMSSNWYHHSVPTTIHACITSYENQVFANTNLGSLSLPTTISTIIFNFLNNIVATFSDYVLPLNLDTSNTFLYFIFDYNLIGDSQQPVYCGITNHFQRRMTEHLNNNGTTAQFYKHCLSDRYFIVGFSLQMQQQSMEDLESLCILTCLHFDGLTPLNVLFHPDEASHLASLFKRFTLKGIFIANNRAFSINQSVVQALQDRRKHGFLKYLLTKTNEYNSIVISGIYKHQPIPPHKIVFHNSNTFPFVTTFLKTDTGLTLYNESVHIQLLLLFFLVKQQFEPLPPMVQAYLQIVHKYSNTNDNNNNYWKGLNKIYQILFKKTDIVLELRKATFRVNMKKYTMSRIESTNNNSKWRMRFCNREGFYLVVRGVQGRVKIDNTLEVWKYLKSIGINSANALEAFRQFHEFVINGDKK